VLKICNHQQGELTTSDQEFLITIHYSQAIVLLAICLQADNFRHLIHAGSQQKGPTSNTEFSISLRIFVLILCSLLSLVHSFISSLTVFYAKKVIFFLHSCYQPHESSKIQNFILLSRNTEGQYQLVEK